MLSIEDLIDHFQKEKESILNDFFTFLRFPSIATDTAFKQDVLACAEWICTYLSDIGLAVELWETEGAPTVFASDMRAGEQAETLLIYGHYDVQPVDPIELWTTPPFEPSIRDGSIFARGALDDKGQCFYTICALKTLLESGKPLPVNLKFLIEGEEESGSGSLFGLLEAKQEALKADHLLIVDSGLAERNQPAITLGARGISCMTVTVTGSPFDLHSGMVGGAVYNPNRALVELLSKLHDAHGLVAIPGFYDEVVEMPRSEKELLDISIDAEKFTQTFKIPPSGLEKGMTPGEAVMLRPTVEINGISGGYAGAGFKTVIPARASAKISCRLVPQQNPFTISRIIKEFLLAQSPEGVEVDVEVHPGHGEGFRTNPQSKIAETMAEAYTQVFQKPCEKILIGGSIPIAAELARISGAEMVLVGVGLPTDLIHAPNEHFGIDRFELGYLTIVRGIELLGKK